jgi:hypothetical protein
MMQRVWILTLYFSKSVFFSLGGLMLLIVSLVYWAVFFPPGQTTPDIENYIILVGVLGAVATFVATLAAASKAGRLENYPLLVRLPSRIEYLVSVILSGLVIGLVLQLLVALLALIRGPDLSTAHWFTIPPLWLSVNILAAVLAIHATDMVSASWSRVIIFGFLAILLILNGSASGTDSWFAARLNDLATVFSRMNLMWFADLSISLGGLLGGDTFGRLGELTSQVFWPFRAMIAGVFAGHFSSIEALAPAVVMLYGTILFLIAAILFSGKDLEFVE